MKNLIDRLTDAQEMARNNPDTFTAPIMSDLKRLKKGMQVKICVDERSRFWIEINSIDNENIIGRIDNDLPEFDDLEYNDIVLVQLKHVYDLDNVQD